jgi:hypothetical protein
VQRGTNGGAQAVGIDARDFSGHSCRSGFLSSAAAANASIWKMVEVSRHKNLDTLRGYIRKVDAYRSHAGEGFL